ncbi:MAG: general stress protein CsbD [Rhodothermales bacterium]
MATSNMNDNWTFVKSQIELIWRNAEFDDTELKRARGNLRKMVDLIHEKTGESPMEIRQKMSAIF